MNTFRQGDVILVEVKKLPKFTKKISDVFSVNGETGESHTMKAEVLETITIRGIKQPDVRIVKVEEGGAVMVHPQHPDLNVPAGMYTTRKVRTFSPERQFTYDTD